jgi:hypothetical protein
VFLLILKTIEQDGRINMAGSDAINLSALISEEHNQSLELSSWVQVVDLPTSAAASREGGVLIALDALSSLELAAHRLETPSQQI